MPQGVPTPEDQLARFRAHYLYSGNASESARAVELPESTGRDLAQRLVDDPEFVAARRKLRAQEVDECVAARRRVRQTALERFESETGGIDVRQFGGEDASVVITDKRHEYGKLVLDAEKNAHNLAKIDSDNSSDASPLEVTINVKTDRDTEPAPAVPSEGGEPDGGDES